MMESCDIFSVLHNKALVSLGSTLQREISTLSSTSKANTLRSNLNLVLQGNERFPKAIWRSPYHMHKASGMMLASAFLLYL